MFSFIAKAAFSGVMVALIATIAKRHPGWGGLLASLPLTSLLAITLLWVDSRDAEKVAGLAQSTLWFLVPSMPLFLALPAMLRSGIGFWTTWIICVGATLLLYAATFWVLPRFGVKL